MRSPWVPRLASLLCVCAPAAAGAQRVDTLRFRVAWEVVEGRHPTADSLGELSGLAVDHRGNVYVSDFSAAKIWIFDRSGRAVPGIGRKGKGPGEFEAPTGLGIAPDGRLLVRDISRVTAFTVNSDGRLTKYDRAFGGPSMADWRSKLPTRFGAGGTFYYPAFNVLRRTGPAGHYLRYRLDGRFEDSLAVPGFPHAPAATARVQVDANSGRTLAGLNHTPFAPLPSWDLTPRGTLLVAGGDLYEVRELAQDGSIVRTLRRAVKPEPISDRLRRDSTAALKARLDSVRVPLDRVEGMPPDVRALRLPETFPPIMRIYAAADGRAWVRRWPSTNPQESVFDVFDVDGRFTAVVILPGLIAIEPTPVLTLNSVTAIGIDPISGANTVVSFTRAAPR